MTLISPRFDRSDAVSVPPSAVPNAAASRTAADSFLNHNALIEEDLNPHLLHWMAAVILGSLLIFLIWAATAPFKQLSRIEAEVTASFPVQRIEAPEAGLMAPITLHEGDEVSAGQELARMDGAALEAERRQLAIRATALELDRRRLEALLDGGTPDFSGAGADDDTMAAQRAFHLGQQVALAAKLAVMADERAALRADLAASRGQLEAATQRRVLVGEQSQIVDRLQDKGARPRVDVLEAGIRRSSADGDLAEITGAIGRAEAALELSAAREADLVASTRAGWLAERADAVRARDEARQALVQIDDRIAHAVIRAPARGLVMEILAPRRSAVVAAGDEILRIAPLDSDLRIAARINPADVGRLRPDHPVTVRFPAYDLVQTRPATGRIVTIMPATTAGADGRTSYHAYVALDDLTALRAEGIILHAGMAAQVNAVGEDRTLLEYLFKPMKLLKEKLFTQP